MDVSTQTTSQPSTSPSRSRRAILGLAVGTALGALPAGLAVAKRKGGQPAKNRAPGSRRAAKRRRQSQRRFKVVTRTFSNEGPILIPEVGPANPYPSTIQVQGLRAGTILDVNVTFRGFSHEYPEDLDIVLVAPGGKTAVVLMNNVGGSDPITNVTLTFDDSAADWLPFDAPIVSGTYKPTIPGVAPRPETASLRSFNGAIPNGVWRLYVADGNGGDEGSLDSWELTIRARVRR